jgi:hypothetical protein
MVFKVFDTPSLAEAVELLSAAGIPHRVLPFRDAHTPERQHTRIIVVPREHEREAVERLKSLSGEMLVPFPQPPMPTPMRIYNIVVLVLIAAALIVAFVRMFIP